VRSADQEAGGGPREGGSRAVEGATATRVACERGAASPRLSTGNEKTLVKAAVDVEPQQNAQCAAPCPEDCGRGKVGPDPGTAAALRIVEQKSSAPGSAAGIAYAASGASTCASSATNRSRVRIRVLITAPLYSAGSAVCRTAFLHPLLLDIAGCGRF
jgi:hypothetical protein